MAGLRMARLGAAAVAASLILAGCSLGGTVRQAPNPNNTTSGRPPTELTRMDSAAVAIYNAAVPQNAGTAGASAQDMIGRNATAGTAAPTGPGNASIGTDTGTGGATQPGANNSGGGTGMTGPTGNGTTTGGPGTTGATGTGTAGAGTTGSTGTAGTTGTGSTGTGPGPATTGTGTAGTSARGTTGTGTAGTGTNTNATAPGTASGTTTGTTASPGVTTPRTTSTGTGVDWTRIHSEYTTITSTWSAVRGTVGGQGANADMLSAVDSAVSSLGTAVTGQNSLLTAMAANDLTAYTATLIGLYRPGTPVQIYQLEYLSREIQLDTENGNAEGALDAARDVGGVWVSLRTTAMARNQAHAGAIDTDVGRLEKDVASGANLDLRSDAATLLRDLHTLTRDFLTATR